MLIQAADGYKSCRLIIIKHEWACATLTEIFNAFPPRSIGCSEISPDTYTRCLGPSSRCGAPGHLLPYPPPNFFLHH